MRRKSSAGNLFNFRNPSSSSNPLSSSSQLAMYPAPLQMGGFMASQPSIPTSAASSHSTDTASTLISPTGHVTPVGREWDQQSASESNPGHSSVLSTGSAGINPSGLPPNQLDLLRETMNKRIMTLTYLRSTHEGSVAISLTMI